MKVRLSNKSIFKVSNKRGWILFSGQGLQESSSVILEEQSIPFCSCLSYEWQDIDTVVNYLMSIYIDVSYETLKSDAINFYYSLAKLNMVEIKEDHELQLNPTEFLIEERELTGDIQDFIGLRSVHIELTNRCNERCVHCYIPHQEKIKDMDDVTLNKILEEIESSSSVLSISVSGGEPMLHPRFIEVVKRLQAKQIRLTIFTNLTVMTDDMLELFKRPLTTVQVSLYSMNAKVHDKVTTISGSFNRTFNNIKKLLNNGVNIEIACPLMDVNISDNVDVYKWCLENNIRCKQDADIMAECDFCTSNLSHRPNNETLKNMFKKTLAEKSVNINIEDVKREYNPETIVCGVGLNSVAVSANGDVCPCPSWAYICGNVKDNTLSDILLKSPAFTKIRNIKRSDFKKCNDCGERAFCQICFAKNANENHGDYMKITDHNCEITRLYYEALQEYCSEH